MNLQTELDILAQKIASFHEPESVDDAQWLDFVENTTVALMAGGESSRFSSVLEGARANKSAFELPNGVTMIEMCIRTYRDMGFKHFVALVFHAFITLPLAVRLVARKSPRKHLRNMSAALLTAFSTASSSATLPLTIDAVENKSGVSNRVTSFTLPLGATINMDGTALYECVAVIFIAQAYGVDLSFGQQLVVVLTALLASIGAAGIPMAGLVMMTIVLTAVNLPLEGVGLILAVDRVLDMVRTAVNVWSDSCGSVIVASSEGEELGELSLE